MSGVHGVDEMHIPKSPGWGGEKRKVTQKAGLRGTGQDRGGWLCKHPVKPI